MSLKGQSVLSELYSSAKNPKSTIRQWDKFFPAFNNAVKKSDTILVDLGQDSLKPSKGIADRQQNIPMEGGKLIGRGLSKNVFLFKNGLVCFLPNNINEKNWETMITEECILSQEVAKIGIKTQAFSIGTMSVRDPDFNKFYSIKVLVSKGFPSLAKEENISILDRNNSIIFGDKVPFFNGMKKNIKNKEWLKKMFQPIIDEITIARSYGAVFEDALNFYVEKPKDLHSPSVIHMFMYDFTVAGSATFIPTSLSLKQPQFPSRTGIKTDLYRTINSMFNLMSEDELSQLGLDSFDLSNNIIEFMENGSFLDEMLAEAIDKVLPPEEQAELRAALSSRKIVEAVLLSNKIIFMNVKKAQKEDALDCAAKELEAYRARQSLHYGYDIDERRDLIKWARVFLEEVSSSFFSHSEDVLSSAPITPAFIQAKDKKKTKRKAAPRHDQEPVSSRTRAKKKQKQEPVSSGTRSKKKQKRKARK